MEQIENRMVVDSEWRGLEAHAGPVEGLCGKGWKEFHTGIFVPEGEAYEYALERMRHDEDLKKAFVEWFYSGEWIKED